MVSPTFSADFSQRRFFGLFIAIMEMRFFGWLLFIKNGHQNRIIRKLKFDILKSSISLFNLY